MIAAQVDDALLALVGGRGPGPARKWAGGAVCQGIPAFHCHMLLSDTGTARAVARIPGCLLKTLQGNLFNEVHATFGRQAGIRSVVHPGPE